MRFNFYGYKYICFEHEYQSPKISDFFEIELSVNEKAGGVKYFGA
jgi:hypothetical protein